MKKTSILFYALLLALSLIVAGCGDKGPAGTPGAQGEAGVAGEDGGQGPVGQTGTTGGLPIDALQAANFHGAANALEATRGSNNSANLCTDITKAVVNSDGKLVIDYTVKSIGADKICGTGDDTPYTGLTNTSPTATGTTSTITFRFAQLRNGIDAGDTNYWVNYNNAKARKKPGYGFAQYTGLELNQPSGEGSSTTGGVWAEIGGGAYRYTTNKVLTSGIDVRAFSNYSATLPNRGVYSYDYNLPHRVAIQVADHDGPTGPALHGANNPIYDFIPGATGDGTETADPREVVVVSNCNDGCHNTLGLHGGGRLDTKLCVMCHNPTNGDPESGNNLDFKVMIHKIHSAKYLPSVKFDITGSYGGLYGGSTGPNTAQTSDGTIYPDKAIYNADGTVNAAGPVKGTPYTIWGFNNARHDYSEVLFPANPANCTKCHKNALHGDRHKAVPTKEACGSCHDGINFATGTGGRIRGDINYALAKNSANYYRFRNLTTIGHGTAAGIGPKTNADCVSCHAQSGAQASMDTSPVGIPESHDFVAKRQYDYTIDTFTITGATGIGGYFAAGDAPVVTIKLKDNVTGTFINHSTMTRKGGAAGFNTANLYVSGPRALRKPVLTTAAADPAWFSTTTPKTPGGSAANTLYNYSSKGNTHALNDPKVKWYSDRIEYQLSAIPTNMTPGTYVSMVHFYRGGGTTTNPNPKTMSTRLITFNIGQASEEKKVASNCTDCHENTLWHDNAVNGVPGNHPASFDPDYCGNCHDYLAQQGARTGTHADGTKTTWKGGTKKWGSTPPAGYGYSANNLGFSAAPIARRVHGVHYAKKADGTTGVNYPYEIYNGHNVSIVFPQDPKNCEKCHPASTSGTWKTKPSRVACLACHDSLAATAHGTLQTYDLTPTASTDNIWNTASGPFSGDEQESCAVCHAP